MIIFLFLISWKLKNTLWNCVFQNVTNYEGIELFAFGKKYHTARHPFRIAYILSGTSIPSREQPDLMAKPTASDSCTLNFFSFSSRVPRIGTVW